MTKAEIKLSYGHNGETYSGEYVVSTGNPPDSKRSFVNYFFPRMMSNLATYVRDHDECTVVLSRLEVEDSEYILDEGTVELLRRDPAAAIQSMMHEDRVIYIRDSAKSSGPPPVLLRAGHDTLAAAFGDTVYCKVNPLGKFECVGCGRWSIVTPTSMPCTVCGLRLYGSTCGSDWFCVKTTDLLARRLGRYYLPRLWNPRGWISHDELHAMYKDFNKERRDAE